jgi:hypothetical protein
MADESPQPPHPPRQAVKPKPHRRKRRRLEARHYGESTTHKPRLTPHEPGQE